MSDINVASNQYVVLNDWIFSSSNAVDAPEWLVTLIDNVVSSLIASNFTDYNLLVEEVRNAIDSLNVAQNSFDQYWNLESLIDGIVLTYVQTLNASIQDSQAQIVNLQQAIATTEFSLAQAVQDITANYQDYADARATEITTAFANADAALASSIQALTTVYEDQQTDLEGFANAVEALESYVGITGDGSTGLLGTVNTLKEQTDGIIEYYFLESYDDPAGFNGDSNFFLTATDEASALALILAVWETVELKNAAHGNIVYFKDSTNAYSYNSSNNAWYSISDTNLYEAVKAAADAQTTADGKVSQYYAWENVSANGPVNTSYGDPLVTISGSSWKFWYQPDTENLYYWDGSTWLEVTNAFDGDMLTTFDPVALDYSFYTYNEATGEWVPTSPRGIVANSKWAIDLESEVSAFPEQWASADSVLQNTVESYADAQRAAVEAKFEYGSILEIDGEFYQSGFGLVSSGSATYNEEGSQIDPFDSEFWINAERFVLKSPSYPTVEAAFTVTASGISLSTQYTEATRNVPRGSYSNTTEYRTGDMVTYEGSSYVYSAIAPSTGNLPTDTDYWQLLAQAGILGQSVDYWFKRSTTVPTDEPNSDGSNANQWFTSLSDVNADNTAGDLYTIKGVKDGSSGTWTFDSPVLQSAENVKELVIYSDVTTGSITKPTNGTSKYNFKTGVLTINDTNWNRSVPAIANDGEKIYVTTALVTGNETQTAVGINWETPNVYAYRNDGKSPTVVDNGDNTYTITDADGNQVTISDGLSDIPTITDNGNGTYTITNSNGDSVTVSDGETPVINVDYFDGVNGSFVSFVYKTGTTVTTPTDGSFDGTTEVLPTGGWTDTPTATENEIEWVSTTRYSATRNESTGVITWSNNGWSTPSRFYKKGETGVSYTGTIEYYRLSSTALTDADRYSSGITIANTWSTTPQTPTSVDKYLYNFNRSSKSDETFEDSSVTLLTQYVKDGKGILSIAEKYQLHTSGTTAPTGTWSTSIPEITEAKPYLWNQTTISYTEGDDTVVTTLIAARGTNGNPGVSYTGTTEYYKLSNTTTPPDRYSSNTTLANGWETTPQTPTSSNQYLWNFNRNSKSDGTFTDSPVSLITQYVTNGNPGKGILSISQWYQSNNSATTAPTTDWQTSFASATPLSDIRRYMWNRTLVNYTDGTDSDYIYTVIAVRGGDGTSITGPRGTATLTATYSNATYDVAADSLTSAQVQALWAGVAPTNYDATSIEGDVLIVTNTSTGANGGTNIYKKGSSAWASSAAFKVNGDAIVEGTLVVGNEVFADGFLTGTDLQNPLNKPTTSYSGTIIDSRGIRVYDNGVLRIKIGNLAN